MNLDPAPILDDVARSSSRTTVPPARTLAGGCRIDRHEEPEQPREGGTADDLADGFGHQDVRLGVGPGSE